MPPPRAKEMPQGIANMGRGDLEAGGHEKKFIFNINEKKVKSTNRLKLQVFHSYILTQLPPRGPSTVKGVGV